MVAANVAAMRPWVGPLWAAVVLIGGWRWWRGPTSATARRGELEALSLRALAPRGEPSAAPQADTTTRDLGRRDGRIAGRRLARSPVAQLVAVTLIAVPFVGLAAPLLGVGVQVGLLLRTRRRRRSREERDLVEVVEIIELTALGVRAGDPLATSLHRTCAGLPRASAGGELSEDLATAPTTTAALQRWSRRRKSPDRVAAASVLAVALSAGGPVADRLDRRAERLRHRVRQQRLAHARTLPVRLLPPLVVCTLPAFVAVTVVPLIVVSLRSMTPAW